MILTRVMRWWHWQNQAFTSDLMTCASSWCDLSTGVGSWCRDSTNQSVPRPVYWKIDRPLCVRSMWRQTRSGDLHVNQRPPVAGLQASSLARCYALPWVENLGINASIDFVVAGLSSSSSRKSTASSSINSSYRSSSSSNSSSSSGISNRSISTVVITTAAAAAVVEAAAAAAAT